MSRQVKVWLAMGLIIITAGLGSVMAYLLRQGLDQASLWASYLGLPLTVCIAVSGVWAVILAARALRTERQEKCASGQPASSETGHASAKLGPASIGQDVTAIADGECRITTLPPSVSRLQINTASGPGATVYGVINGNQYIHRSASGADSSPTPLADSAEGGEGDQG